MTRLAQQIDDDAIPSSLEESLAENLIRPTPSWFPPHASATVEELADRYRQRERERAAPARPPRPTRTPQRERDEALAQAVHRTIPKPHGRGAGTYVAVGLLAVFTGGMTGYGFAHAPQLTRAWQAAIGSLSSAKGETVIAQTGDGSDATSHKLIPTATLKVADVSGRLNDAIPLVLQAEPPAGGDALVLKVGGLPESSYLTAGSRVSPTEWQLDPAQAQSVKLVVPHAASPSYDLSVAAFERTTGALAAPIKEVTLAINNPEAPQGPPVVKPGQALIPAPIAPDVTIAPAAAPAGAMELVARGNQLLAAGELTAARAFFEQAFAQGAADGALGMGKTYDPVVFKTLKVNGLAPDPAQALAWYGKAATAGQIEAGAAMAALKAATQ